MSIYKNFNIVADDSIGSSDIVTNVKDVVSSGMWANNAGSITTFYTSSTQYTNTGDYYMDLYSADPQSDSNAQSQFSIAYGHFDGSGSLGAIGASGNRNSAAIYNQLSNVLLGPNEKQFTFAGTGNNIKPKYIYAISIARQQLREKMDPGNWELHLSGSGSGSADTGHPSGLIKLIDDSGATNNPEMNQGGRVFNVVSGSIATGKAITKTAAALQPGGSYGLFYPDLGMIILNGPILNASASLGFDAEATPTGSTNLRSNVDGNNNIKFSAAIHSGSKFQARREEVITSQHYFCRVPNREFNFSSNPTFATGSNGTLTIPTFYKNPKTFITQVGLYNDNNELLAVAKLSKPLLKSYSREAIIKVKLDF